jgi:hypothetical protein
MWKILGEWFLTLVNMTRELEENRASVRELGKLFHELEKHTRETDEALKLLAQELRHARDMESAEREKFMLQLEGKITKLKELGAPRRKKKR